MKRATISFLSVLVAGMLLMFSASARADFFVGDYNGDNLIRRGYTLANNQWLTVQTTGCDTNGGDTVIFLLEGSLGSATAVTRGFNDDFNGNFCSYIVFQNTSGVTKDYTVVVTTYNPATPTNVQLLIQRTPDARTTESVTVGGVTHRWGGNGSAETIQTVPVRGAHGGQAMDSVLFVINPAIGGTAKYDDDSGVRFLSRIANNLDCTNITCWVVAGNFSYGSFGGNIDVWSQNASNDSDGDGISNSLEQTLTSFGRLPAGADTKKDSDQDGLSDFVELVGVPVASLTGWDASLIMPWQGNLGGPDPAIQDVFVEVDWMEDTAPATAHSHKPFATLGADLTSIFTGDQAWTTRNIRVHHEVSQNVGHWDRISYASCGGAQDVNFYTIKNNASYFDPLRKSVYHYVIAAHAEKDESCVSTGASGRAEIFGNDVYVSLASGFSNAVQRGTHVHEMGHNFYLTHNSNDNTSDANRSCVHSSVMNYKYQLGGWTNAGNALRAFGYSNGTCLSGNTGGSCTNTCTNRCVTNGQVTPKITCPVATSGPNAGKHVSNGTCDCDLTEWTQPASPTAGRLTLAFQTSGDAGDGAPTGGTDLQAKEEYQQGGLGQRRAFTGLHQKFADAKRKQLLGQGMREGVDFVINSENGKAYSAH